MKGCNCTTTYCNCGKSHYTDNIRSVPNRIESFMFDALCVAQNPSAVNPFITLSHMEDYVKNCLSELVQKPSSERSGNIYLKEVTRINKSTAEFPSVSLDGSTYITWKITSDKHTESGDLEVGKSYSSDYFNISTINDILDVSISYTNKATTEWHLSVISF